MTRRPSLPCLAITAVIALLELPVMVVVGVVLLAARSFAKCGRADFIWSSAATNSEITGKEET